MTVSIGGVQFFVTKFYPPQIDGFIENLSLHSISSSHPTQTPIIPRKASLLTSVALKKQTIVHNSAMSKDMTNTAGEGTIPLHTIDRKRAAEDTGSSSQRAVANARLPLLYESQTLQMLADTKEQMKEQQARSDHDREQAALDRENVASEQEALKQLCDQLRE